MDNNQNGGYPDNQGYYQQQQNGGYPDNQGYYQQQQNGYGMPYPQQNQNGQPGMTPQQPNMGYGMPQQPNMGYGMAGGNTPPKKKKTGLIVGLIILAVVLIAGGIFAFLKFGKKDESKEAVKTVKAFCEGMKDKDMDAMVETYHPDLQGNVKNNFCASMNVDTEDEFWDAYDVLFGGFSFDYEIGETEEMSESQIKKVLDTVNDALDLSISAKKMYKVNVEETYSGSNGKLVQEEDIYIIKVDKKWYIVNASSKLKENTLTAAQDTEEVTEEETTEEETTEEETTEKETTEEETTTESASTGTTSVPEDGFDWDNMQFSLNGKSYSLSSLTYEDIKAMGYEIEDEYLEEELEENQYSMSVRATAADESYIYVRFKNFTSGAGTRKVPDCEILGISMSRDSWDNQYDAGLGNGVTFGMTVDEVKAIMGEPTSDYKSDDSDYVSLTYEEDDQAYANSVDLTFSDGTLDEIDIENYK